MIHVLKRHQDYMTCRARRGSSQTPVTKRLQKLMRTEKGNDGSEDYHQTMSAQGRGGEGKEQLIHPALWPTSSIEIYILTRACKKCHTTR